MSFLTLNVKLVKQPDKVDLLIPQKLAVTMNRKNR